MSSNLAVYRGHCPSGAQITARFWVGRANLVFSLTQPWLVNMGDQVTQLAFHLASNIICEILSIVRR